MRILSAGLFFFGALCFSWTAHSATQDPKHFIVDVMTINGEEFVVKDEAGTEAKIHVGSDTEKFGHVKPGDRIDAWVYQNGHAKTIMVLRSASIIQEDRELEKSAQAQQRNAGQGSPGVDAQR
jgi:hypothetical protein